MKKLIYVSITVKLKNLFSLYLFYYIHVHYILNTDRYITSYLLIFFKPQAHLFNIKITEIKRPKGPPAAQWLTPRTAVMVINM